MTKEQLLKIGRVYAAHTGLKMTTLGVYAANDGKFFKRLEAGASCTLGRTEDRDG